jgi:bis(5'-nucleosidyl)-tetraphosphatase
MRISVGHALRNLVAFLSGKDFSYGVIPFHKDKKGYTVFVVQHKAGHWGIPKGHAEVREKPIQAAQRELLEETGLETEKLFPEPTFYEKYFFTIKNKPIFKTVAYYLGEVKNTKAKLQADEIQAGKWLTFTQAIEQVPYKPTKKMLKEVQKYLEKKAKLETT